MMTILLFAHLQDKVGAAKLELNYQDISVDQLKDIMAEKYGLDDLDQVMVAINEEYALQDDIIHNGDIVAFIPPVSGG